MFRGTATIVALPAELVASARQPRGATSILLQSLAIVGCLFGTSPVFAQQDDAGEQQVISPFPEQAPPHQVLLHPHREQRDKYLWGTFGPPGLLESTIEAGFDHWVDTPSIWGQTSTAFVKRFATEYSESAINATTKYVLARLADEDPSFHACSCSGFRRRALHAIASPFVAYRFDDGRPQFSLARTAGTAASSVISANTWKPSTPSAGAQIAHVGMDLVSAMGVSLLREFVFHHRPE